ncbi:MAG: AtpZ/AtpI family protein [Gemmatimonadetes bacterium]|jgi:F0F1-type ATP synthase assembly protein I|nr:AtpZ/AtpI family protein [Gemmatimonadota bacterium]MCC6770353.1 AtpZ/AtpI family protein [Gemmatimonadaceae bacterium]
MTPDPLRPTDAPTGESEDQRASRAAGKYAGIGLQFAASVLLFLFAGQWLDRRFHTEPWGVLVGVLVGAAAAFYSMYRRLMADLERDEQAKRRRREEHAKASADRNRAGDA